MKALLDLFKQVTQEEEFDAIKIALASPEKKSQKPLTIVRSSLSVMVCSVQKSLVQLKITNVYVVNTNA